MVLYLQRLVFRYYNINLFFCFGGKNFLVSYTGIVLSLELTYNGTRDLYASMKQQIQTLNSQSKLPQLLSLDNPVYYKNARSSKGPQTFSIIIDNYNNTINHGYTYNYLDMNEYYA